MSEWKALEKRLRSAEEKTTPASNDTLAGIKKGRDDPVYFAKRFLNFQSLPYQEKVLTDRSKRIAVRMSRQAGKTTTIAVRGIWYSATHPRTLSLIVAPSLRQSMIMMDRVQGFLYGMKPQERKAIVGKMQRTTIWFRNASQMVALPCSPNLLRGYTAHQVLADEAAFFRDDEIIFYNILYPMLATTNGTLIASSTPWATKSVFYQMCKDQKLEKIWSRHHVTWRDVVAAGLMTQDFIDEMQTVSPPERFIREFDAEFSEDVDAYLPRELIVSCIWTDTWHDLNPRQIYYPFESTPRGRFSVGIDLGEIHDHSVLSVVERWNNRIGLVHCHQFPLKTPYATVIGYTKALCDRFQEVEKVLVDATRESYVVKDMQAAGITQVTPVIFSMQSKMEMAKYFKEQMQLKTFALPYDPDVIAELNVEKYELTKDGNVKFNHDEGTHDDRFWSIALAVYASRESEAPAFIPIRRR
jgi:phage FluMu gp28-like protein